MYIAIKLLSYIIGEKLAKMLDKKLVEYNAKQGRNLDLFIKGKALSLNLYSLCTLMKDQKTHLLIQLAQRSEAHLLAVVAPQLLPGHHSSPKQQARRITLM